MLRTSFLLFAAFLLELDGAATTWYADRSVSRPGDGRSWESAFEHIQQGIDAASQGDAVIVSEGVYVENVRLNGKNIVLTSTNPPNATVVAKTIIDGNQVGSVVAFSGAESESSLLSGFTIRNGKADYGGGICGGASDRPTRATVSDNIITGNDASWEGGGLAYCGGEILGNTISRNTASRGAGLAQCHGAIRGNIIRDNSAFADGGGLYKCEGAVAGNRIIGNSVTGQYYGGGGLALCNGAVENNLITGNSAYKGGGLYACSGTVQNNTICGNSASHEGGGLASCYGAIRNCIIWGNTGWSGGPNQIAGGNIPSFSCVQNWTGGGEGNTAEDPGLTANNRLQEGSPCMNAGANYYWFVWPQKDLAGNCRLTGGRVDMGCYEYNSARDSDGDLLSDDDEKNLGTNPANADSDEDGVRDGLEVLRNANPLIPTPPRTFKVPSEFLTIQAAVCLSGRGDEVVVSPGLYKESVHFCGVDVVLRSAAPTSPEVVAGTVLDGGGRGPVVSFTGWETEACVLSGFTIQNGRAFRGAGIRGGTQSARTRASIRNNTVENNAGKGDEYYSACGGGVAFCDGTVRSNTISNNSSDRGGGIAYCNGVIESNLVTRNSSTDDGAGIAHCDGIIRQNTILENSAGHGGGGICECDGEISNNLIVANGARYAGGAMYYCNGVMRNNTICQNSCEQGSGGLSECRGEIVNCIIWGNIGGGPSQLSGSYAPSYSCIQNWPGGGIGNISLNPHFVDFKGRDFHLQTWSPCVDAGDPSSDFSNEPEPNGGRIDMGAYGNTPEATSKSPDSDADACPTTGRCTFSVTSSRTPPETPTLTESRTFRSIGEVETPPRSGFGMLTPPCHRPEMEHLKRLP